MNANDVARQKYLQLMTQVEDLEDRVEQLARNAARASELKSAQEELAAARTELARLSDGCGVPHAR